MRDNRLYLFSVFACMGDVRYVLNRVPPDKVTASDFDQALNHGTTFSCDSLSASVDISLIFIANINTARANCNSALSLRNRTTAIQAGMIYDTT